jgi:hypothetical protein
MKDAVPPMTGVQLKASKGDRLRVLNQAAGADSIQALQRRADSLRPSATAPTATEAQKNELRDLDTRIRDLTQERDRLQADVTELDAMKRETDTARAEMRIKRDNIIDLINALATRVPPKTIPGTEGLNAALGSFSFDGNDYFQLEATPGAAAPRWGHVDVINSVIHAKLGLGPDRAISVSDSGIFNSPLVARDAMAALYQKLDEESRAPAAPPAAPAAAPAGPAAPPPAEEGGPREF